jgi:hypothetical protein
MQHYSDHTSKTKSIETTIRDPWKQSSNTDEEEEDTNIMWNGKVILSPKQHGKMNQPSLMMAT